MEKIRNYINELFEKTPKTKKVVDFKEELIADLQEKYEDLIENGKSEKEAYKEVIVGIGDIDELLINFDKSNSEIINFEETMIKHKRKSAAVVSLSVGLYILSVITIIVLTELNVPDFVSVSSFLTIAAIPTCILIYHYMSIPKYEKLDDTMIEEFKEWKLERNKKHQLTKSILSIYWSFIVLIYFIISFVWGIWHISWLIFIIGGIVENIIEIMFDMKR